MPVRSTSIEFRATAEEKSRLSDAAKTLGLDLSSFIRMTALREATLLERRQQLVLSDADRQAFLEALDEDPEPTPALIHLFKNRAQ